MAMDTRLYSQRNNHTSKISGKWESEHVQAMVERLDLHMGWPQAAQFRTAQLPDNSRLASIRDSLPILCDTKVNNKATNNKATNRDAEDANISNITFRRHSI